MERKNQLWRNSANDALNAAGLCLRNRHYRSAASRAYYSVFSAATAALLKAGQSPPRERGTWSHKLLPDIVRSVLSGRLGPGRVRDVRRMLNVSYSLRVIADYRPELSIDAASARRVVADARTLFRHLEFD
jgi:uncharacterized protein (UPF0332 family)